MSSDAKKETITREALLAMLSDAEPRLVEGDEYVDLEDPSAGVRQVHAKSARPRKALPRSAVSDATWGKIVGLVGR
jgi:hypothetical protein